jgi:hypothetical protein
MDSPLAFHLTWTTFGTWLHGAQRGWVEKGVFEIQQGDPEREELARKKMRDSEVTVVGFCMR